jgi:hypothetical protein
MDKEPNMRAVLVRDGDYFIPLAQRVSKSRRMQADLFVSIHADAWVRPDARGSSVFALSERGATTAAARMLAKKENESDAIGGVNLGAQDPVLATHAARPLAHRHINDSLKLGKAVLGELGDINTLHKNSVEQAGFAVLKAPDIPSILVETAFISNPDEEARSRTALTRTRWPRPSLGGIKRYLAQNPPLARDKQVGVELPDDCDRLCRAAAACARQHRRRLERGDGAREEEALEASQWLARRKSSCARVSTPSAITRSFRRLAIAMMASVIEPLEASSGTFMMNERSIFMLVAGRRFSWPSDE